MNTEANANELWCPMQQKPRSREFSSSGDNCIASQCAMWRWQWVPRDQDPVKGYCGLAGNPGAAA